jgi:hypothetical protein
VLPWTLTWIRSTAAVSVQLPPHTRVRSRLARPAEVRYNRGMIATKLPRSMQEMLPTREVMSQFTEIQREQAWQETEPECAASRGRTDVSCQASR